MTFAFASVFILFLSCNSSKTTFFIIAFCLPVPLSRQTDRLSASPRRLAPPLRPRRHPLRPFRHLVDPAAGRLPSSSLTAPHPFHLVLLSPIPSDYLCSASVAASALLTADLPPACLCFVKVSVYTVEYYYYSLLCYKYIYDR